MQQSFSALGVSARVVRALERRGIRAPFAVQLLVLPDALGWAMSETVRRRRAAILPREPRGSRNARFGPSARSGLQPALDRLWRTRGIVAATLLLCAFRRLRSSVTGSDLNFPLRGQRAWGERRARGSGKLESLEPGQVFALPARAT